MSLTVLIGKTVREVPFEQIVTSTGQGTLGRAYLVNQDRMHEAHGLCFIGEEWQGKGKRKVVMLCYGSTERPQAAMAGH